MKNNPNNSKGLHSYMPVSLIAEGFEQVLNVPADSNYMGRKSHARKMRAETNSQRSESLQTMSKKEGWIQRLLDWKSSTTKGQKLQPAS